jgi:cathepsin H
MTIIACSESRKRGSCRKKKLNSLDAYYGSTTGALEAAYTQATGKAISLSEQQLVDCGFAFNNFGCKGGLPSQAFEYIKYNGGLDTEESYPYQGVNGICQFKAENVGVKVLDSVNITLVRINPS